MHWLDPSVLPTVEGRVAQFTINADGDVDGVLFDDNRRVHVPPHMGGALERLVGIGETLSARYVKPRDGDVYAAVSVTGPGGKTLTDAGPPPKHDRPKKDPVATRPTRLEGRVRVTLHAPKGEVAGAILDDGTQIRLDAKANAELADYFVKGAHIVVWGDAFKRKGVTIVDLDEIAFAKDVEAEAA